MNDWLIDANILAYFVNTGNPFYAEARRAIDELNRRRAPLWVAPQNLTELYATLTRPMRQGGIGKTSADALRDIATVKRLFGLLEDRADTFAAWEALIAATGITGTDCFDIRLAAIMQVYGIQNLLTKTLPTLPLCRE